MDQDRFDTVTRSLATGFSRRRVVAGLLGAALASAAARLRPSHASAQDAADGPEANACPPGTERCGGRCRPRCTGGKVRNRTTCRCRCPGGTQLCGGACRSLCPPPLVRDPVACGCVCPGGQIQCPAGCVDPNTDPNNCGGCGVRCNRNEFDRCANGQCQIVCPPGTAFCGGTCVDTRTDPNNCGFCGNACPHNGFICVAGNCECDPNNRCLFSGCCRDTEVCNVIGFCQAR